MQQCETSRQGSVAELTDVLPRVFGRDVNVRALDRALEQRPMAFQPVHMMDAANVLFRRMFDGAVLIVVAQAVVSLTFVGADNRPCGNVLIDDAFNGIGGYVRDRRGQ